MDFKKEKFFFFFLKKGPKILHGVMDIWDAFSVRGNGYCPTLLAVLQIAHDAL